MLQRRSIPVFLLALVLLLASCGGKFDAPSTAQPWELLDRIVTAAGEYEARDGAVYLTEALTFRSDNEETALSDSQKSMYYGTLIEAPDFSGVESYAVRTAMDAVATEIAVFKVTDRSAAPTVEAFLQHRIDTLRANAVGYKPEEVEKCDNALIVTRGLYVICICTDINEELLAVAENGILNGMAQ